MTSQNSTCQLLWYVIVFLQGIIMINIHLMNFKNISSNSFIFVRGNLSWGSSRDWVVCVCSTTCLLKINHGFQWRIFPRKRNHVNNCFILKFLNSYQRDNLSWINLYCLLQYAWLIIHNFVLIHSEHLFFKNWNINLSKEVIKYVISLR